MALSIYANFQNLTIIHVYYMDLAHEINKNIR